MTTARKQALDNVFRLLSESESRLSSGAEPGAEVLLDLAENWLQVAHIAPDDDEPPACERENCLWQAFAEREEEQGSKWMNRALRAERQVTVLRCRVGELQEWLDEARAEAPAWLRQVVDQRAQPAEEGDVAEAGSPLPDEVPESPAGVRLLTFPMRVHEVVITRNSQGRKATVCLASVRDEASVDDILSFVLGASAAVDAAETWVPGRILQLSFADGDAS